MSGTTASGSIATSTSTVAATSATASSTSLPSALTTASATSSSSSTSTSTSTSATTTTAAAAAATTMPSDSLMVTGPAWSLDRLSWTSTLAAEPSLFAPLLKEETGMRREGSHALMVRFRETHESSPADFAPLIPLLTAIALESPYADVRESVAALFRDVAASSTPSPRASDSVSLLSLSDRLLGPPVSPSRFLTLDQFDHLRPAAPSSSPTRPSAASSSPPSSPSSSPSSSPPSSTPSTTALLERCFNRTGRVHNCHRVLAWHPGYFERFIDTQNHIMSEEGPLLLAWRNYVAIMASSQHNCQYLIRRQEAQFLINGGDPEWLREGLTSPALPPKLAALDELNARMAHQPWTITKDTLRALARGEHSWSLNELVHAVLILASYHAFCTLCQSLGMVEEFDTEGPAEDAFGSFSSSSPALSSSSLGVSTAAAGAGAGGVRPGDVSHVDSSVISPSTAASTPTVASPTTTVATDKSVSSGSTDVDGSVTAGDSRSGAADASGVGGGSGGGVGADLVVGGGGVGDAVGGNSGGLSKTSSSSIARSFSVESKDTPRRRPARSYFDDSIESEDAFKSRLLAGLTIEDNDSLGGDGDDGEVDPPEDEDSEDEYDDFETAGPGDVAFGSASAELQTTTGFRSMLMPYQDFDTKSGVFRTGDFSWEDHGYSLVSRYFSTAAEGLDSLFTIAASMTYNNVGTDVAPANTEPFRQAIWYYVHRLFGIQFDDFEYSLVNRFVPRSIKSFVKHAVTSPETIQSSDFERFSGILRPDEKVHIVILCVEARKQAELMRALSALMDHLTG